MTLGGCVVGSKIQSPHPEIACLAFEMCGEPAETLLGVGRF